MQAPLPRAYTLEQGTIFNGAISNIFPSLTAFGLIITADCDLDNHKSDNVHYITGISYRDWICHAACVKVAEESLKDKLSKKNIDYDTIVRLGISILPEEIELIDASEQEKEQLRSIARIVVAPRPCQCSECHINKHATGAKKTKLKNLIEGKTHGYYFMPTIGNGDDSGYVWLFRDIKSMPYDVAKQIIVHGIERNSETLPIYSKCALDTRQEILTAIHKVPSPNREHLIQAFADTYARIGLEDLPKATQQKYYTLDPKG